MIEKLFEEGVLDYQKLLTKHYQKLDMTHEEYIVMIHLFGLAERKRFNLSTYTLARLSGFKMAQVGEIINTLFDKNMLTIELEKREDKMGETFSLTPLFRKIEEAYTVEIEEQKKAQFATDSEYVISEIEQLQGKSLSSNHLEMIRQWFSEGFTKKNIEDAIQFTISQKRKTINYVDRALRSDPFSEDSSIDEKTAEALRKLIGK